MSQKDINHQIQRDNLKTKIMKKYNVSFTEAEEILAIIEKRKLEKNQIAHSKKQVLKTNNHSKPRTPEHDFDKKDNINSKYLKKENNNQKGNIEYSKKQTLNYKPNNEIKPPNNEKIKTQSNNILITSDLGINENSNNVDSILEEIIPNYNKQISIEVQNVDLTFEVSNEKIDTLKEAFIRTIKRDKSKKIKIHALKNVSFQIYKGEKVGIIGYNGAGKSTLLNVITGIYPPDKGSVTTHGKISPMLSLGAGFDFNFSGRKNIILNGAVLGYSKEYLESKMDEIIEFSELGEFIDIPIKNYSSGMLAKLGFSIATSVNPDILIIDEVLGVGDVNFAKKSRDKMKSLMNGGTTVLLVSHSIPQIRELCDKAIWMDNGVLREMGEVNKVCDHYLKDAEKASNEQLANIQLNE